jgi:SAM-dependent methyltransferase
LNRQRILSDELVRVWELSSEWADWFNDREGTACALCRCNRRSQHLAETLTSHANKFLQEKNLSLDQAMKRPGLRSWQIAEINACGKLHRWLAKHPGLHYSEYGKYPGIRQEDLLWLTYKDASFDLVLTSETLEHVPDVPRALSEISRVLKPGGYHIFSTPVVWDRAVSRTCCSIEDGQLKHLRPPSYHGLAGTDASDMIVMTEFGADIGDILERAGFDVAVERDTTNPAVCTFVTRKSGAAAS